MLPPYVLATWENTTGCFDIHTPSKPVEDYFVASQDALQHLWLLWLVMTGIALCVALL